MGMRNIGTNQGTNCWLYELFIGFTAWISHKGSSKEAFIRFILSQQVWYPRLQTLSAWMARDIFFYLGYTCSISHVLTSSVTWLSCLHAAVSITKDTDMQSCDFRWSCSMASAATFKLLAFLHRTYFVTAFANEVHSSLIVALHCAVMASVLVDTPLTM